MSRKFFAELIGTFVLVFLGTGTAVLGDEADSVVGYVSIALAFDSTIVASAYSIDTVSGAHLNPAVSTAMYLNKRIDSKEFGTYILGQVVGALLGSFTLLAVTGDNATLGQNVVADGYSLVTGFLVEVILTFIFILVILTVTPSRKGNAQLAGLVIGLTLTLIHFVGIPVTGISANPVHSLAPALLAGGDVLSQVWILILAPVIGGALVPIVSQSLLETEQHMTICINFN